MGLTADQAPPPLTSSITDADERSQALLAWTAISDRCIVIADAAERTCLVIEVDVVMFFIVLALIAGGTTLIIGRRARSLAVHVPPGVGARDGVELSQVSNYYRFGKRMAHELSAVLMQDETLPFLPDRRRQTIQNLLDEWESM